MISPVEISEGDLSWCAICGDPIGQKPFTRLEVVKTEIVGAEGLYIQPYVHNVCMKQSSFVVVTMRDEK